MAIDLARRFWQPFFPAAFGEGRHFIPGLARVIEPEGLDAIAVRAWIKHVKATFGLTTTELARLAGLAPSTLNRFVKSDSAANLSATTISNLGKSILQAMDLGEITPKISESNLRRGRFSWTVRVIASIEDTPKTHFEWSGDENFEMKVPLPEEGYSYAFGVELATGRYDGLKIGTILICNPAVLMFKDNIPGQKFILHERIGENEVRTSLRRLSVDPEGKRWLTRLDGDLDSKAFYLEDLLPAGYSDHALVSFGVVCTFQAEPWVGPFVQVPA